MKINLKAILILGSVAFTGITSCSNNAEKKGSKQNDSLQAYVEERLPN